ncbi:MAG: hypothetical protein M3325_08120, partial [Actinomycetota bacterium]|nr:hypothetical protein [Actinomycetota bacterium]
LHPWQRPRGSWLTETDLFAEVGSPRQMPTPSLLRLPKPASSALAAQPTVPVVAASVALAQQSSPFVPGFLTSGVHR